MVKQKRVWYPCEPPPIQEGASTNDNSNDNDDVNSIYNIDENIFEVCKIEAKFHTLQILNTKLGYDITNQDSMKKWNVNIEHKRKK